MPIITSRNTIFNLVPKWLRGFNAYTVLYSIQLVTDALWDMLVAAIKIRFQGYYSDESMPRIASERRMIQGRIESATDFAARLSTWWDVSKDSGTFYRMASELRKYFLPQQPRIQIVSNNGTSYYLAADGTWIVSTVSWNWDGSTAQWSRFWVLIYNDVLGVTGTDLEVLRTATDVLEPTRFVGSDATIDFSKLRSIMEDFRDPHTHCVHIMPILDDTNFWASPPSGNWDRWENRSNYALYWEGTT